MPRDNCDAVRVARFAGFCSGVTISVKKTEELLAEKSVYCIGDLIHNTFVINRLREQGLVVVSDPDGIPPGATVVVRAHGLPLEVIRALKKKKCKIHDLTCPILKKIHSSIKKLNGKKYSIIIIGNPDHAEVKAFTSRVKSVAAVVDDTASVRRLKVPAKCAVICQSTIGSGKFEKVSGEILKKNGDSLVFDTICNEVKLRRAEAVELAKKSRMVIIVGDRKSSNTKNLAKIVKKICPVVMVQDRAGLINKTVDYPAGVVSGASTPRELALEIAEELKKRRRKNR